MRKWGKLLFTTLTCLSGNIPGVFAANDTSLMVRDIAEIKEMNSLGEIGYYINNTLLGTGSSGETKLLNYLCVPKYRTIVLLDANSKKTIYSWIVKLKKLLEDRNKANVVLIFESKDTLDLSHIFILEYHAKSPRDSISVKYYCNGVYVGDGHEGFIKALSDIEKSESKTLIIIGNDFGLKAGYNPMECPYSADNEKLLQIVESKKIRLYQVSYPYMKNFNAGENESLIDGSIYRVPLNASPCPTRVNTKIKLPESLNKLKLTGTYTSLKDFVVKFNESFKNSGYSLSFSCKNLKIDIDIQDAEISYIFNYICEKYNLQVNIKDKQIILEETSHPSYIP